MSQQRKNLTDVKERERITMKTSGKMTGSTMRATTAKIAKHVEQLSSSGENIVESEGKQLKAEEDSKVVRGNSLVRRGKICKLLSD